MLADVNQEKLRIPVSLNHKPYEVVIGASGLNEIGEELIRVGIKPKTKVLVVSNPDVAKPYGDRFLKSLDEYGFNSHLLILDAGEDQKTPLSIAKIHDAAFKAKLERGSLMIALGGGVIGDMTGFAAATWLRGISVVQVPTTLLAMVDASIGGKTGVNHPGGKNLIGAFHQPKLVLIDPLTLNSLPEREFRAGMAEVIKYGVINDYNLFKLLEDAEDLSNLDKVNKHLIYKILERSTSSKANIVVQDEHESGIRAILNYGHTFGHVIETLCGYGTWLHGEAVSMGMIAAGKLALIRKYWNYSDFCRQRQLIEKAGLPVKWPNIDLQEVINSLQGDKKVKDGKVRFIIPYGIGKVKICDNIMESEIITCLKELN